MKQVYIVQTKRDCGVLEQTGVEAICLPLPPRSELYGGTFVILPPKGLSGQIWGRRVARFLQGVAGRVTTLNLADIFPFVDDGEGVAEIIEFYGPGIISEIEEAAQWAAVGGDL